LEEANEKPSPDKSTLNSGVQASGIVERPSHYYNDSHVYKTCGSRFRTESSSSPFSGATAEEALHHSLPRDAADAQDRNANALVLPMHNKVEVKKDADISSGSMKTIGSVAAKRKAAIERNYEPICPSDLSFGGSECRQQTQR